MTEHSGNYHPTARDMLNSGQELRGPKLHDANFNPILQSNASGQEANSVRGGGQRRGRSRIGVWRTKHE